MVDTRSRPIIAGRLSHTDSALRGPSRDKRDRHTGGTPDAPCTCFCPTFRVGARRAVHSFVCYARN